MAMMEWNDNLKVGHSMIEKNHIKLVGLINELGEAMSAGCGRAVCGKILEELMTYSETHFLIEEQLMAVHRYTASSAHKTEHAHLAQSVVELKGKYDAGMATISVILLHFLLGWLAHHSLKWDKALAQKIPGG